MFRSFIVIGAACICAGVIYVSAMLNWGYFPAYAYTNPINRYATFFVILFLSIAILEFVRAFKSKLKGSRYLGAQSFIDIALVVLVISTFLIGTIKIESSRTVRLGNQPLTFSTLDYPLGNEYAHGAKPLFKFDDEDAIHSVYFEWKDTYGFEENVAPSGQARFFRSGVHATDSPSIEKMNIPHGGISTNFDHIYLDEGEYVLEFFPTHSLSKEESARFFKLILDNRRQIRADFRRYLVGPLENETKASP